MPKTSQKIKKQFAFLDKYFIFMSTYPKRISRTLLVSFFLQYDVNSVIAAGADLYLTGEMQHHRALAAQEAGLTCICLSHTVSERFMLKNTTAASASRQPRDTTMMINGFLFMDADV